MSDDHSRGLFAVTQKFKGHLTDTLTIRSEPTSCGISFQAGLAYVVYAREGHVWRCGGSARPVAESQELGKLYAAFRHSFADSLGRDRSPLLNHSEATYFNSELQWQRGSFSFQSQRVAFFCNALRINKQQYVQKWNDQRVINALIVLTPAEKTKVGGFDAIVVSWRKQGISRHFRSRLVRQLSRQP